MGLPLLLVVPALVLAQAQTTFYAAWEDGRDAERRGRFEAALAAYERAAELHPRSQGQVLIYGNNLLRGYYPYTRIARCCLELSRLDAAERALARAEREGEPREEVQALLQRLGRARPGATPVVALPPAVPSAAGPPAQAQAQVPPAPVLQVVPQEAVPRPPREAFQPVPRPVPVPPSAPPPPFQNQVPPPPSPQAPMPLSPKHRWPTGLILAALALGAWALASSAAWAFGRRKRPALDQAFRHPDRVGPYRIERLLGRGGFASTYLARRDHGKSPVALKLLHPFRQEDPEFLGRFRQEARLGSLLDHPNIVKLLDQGPDQPWLVMEYVEGQRLDDFLKERGPLPLDLLFDLARQIASAMAHAHAHGVIHRDLKPGNIMIAGTQVKVMDFGIARIMDAASLTTTYAFLGTPSYAAPEMQFKSQVDAAADRYSFGILLFELASGQTPFQGETPFKILDQHRSADLPDLRALRPDAPQGLVDLVGRLTRKEPLERPEDPEILEFLEALAGQRPE